jgi:hypothetical protein
MVEGAQYGRTKEVKMIEAGTILAGVSFLALALVAGLLARRPAKALVTLRIRNKK